MKKTETELVKVVKALNIMFTQACVTFFDRIITPEEWMMGYKTRTKLVPSTSQEPSNLVSFRVEKDQGFKDTIRPDVARIETTTETLYKFVLAIRKVFTSICDFDEHMLSCEMGSLPTPEDLEWAHAVCISYGVEIEKSKQIILKLYDSEEGQVAIIDTKADEENFVDIIAYLQKKFILTRNKDDVNDKFAKYRVANNTDSFDKKGTIEIREI